VLLPRSSTVEIAASAPAVRLWAQLALQLRQAPDPRAVGAEIGLDVGGQLADGGEVDTEQLCALLERSRERPAHVHVVPGPHRTWGRRSALVTRCGDHHHGADGVQHRGMAHRPKQ
jgi:hypothetical protein